MRKVATDETEKLITEVLGAKLPKQWQSEIQMTVRQELKKLEELRLADIERRLDSREKIRRYLMWLLVGQNVAVFALVAFAMWTYRLEGLQLIFATLTTATLLETTAAIFIIVKWLFSEISYEEKKLP